MQVRLDQKAFAAGDQQTVDRGLVGKRRVTHLEACFQSGVVSRVDRSQGRNVHGGISVLVETDHGDVVR